MIQFDGENKQIILSTDTTFQLIDIYSEARRWEGDSNTIIFHNPFDASDEMLFKLRYGWVFKPKDYATNTTVRVIGKLTTTSGDTKTIPPTSGQPVTWVFDTPATAVIVSTSEPINVWHEPPTPQEISTQVVNDIGDIEISGLTTEQNDQLMKTLTTDKFIALGD